MDELLKAESDWETLQIIYKTLQGFTKLYKFYNNSTKEMLQTMHDFKKL